MALARIPPVGLHALTNKFSHAAFYFVRIEEGLLETT
jgi:hypothetical protein